MKNCRCLKNSCTGVINPMRGFICYGCAERQGFRGTTLEILLVPAIIRSAPTLQETAARALNG
jgi:hypothetical protein